jgi:hypothetical protein
MPATVFRIVSVKSAFCHLGPGIRRDERLKYSCYAARTDASHRLIIGRITSAGWNPRVTAP